MQQPTRVQLRSAAVDREDGRCLWCGRGFGALVPPTTDHVVPRAKGGPSWLENEVAACRRCNGERGHRPAAEWFDECERRGWAPDAGRLIAVLRSLEAAIDERGGQRRARPHLASQLRRMRRLA